MFYRTFTRTFPKLLLEGESYGTTTCTVEMLQNFVVYVTQFFLSMLGIFLVSCASVYLESILRIILENGNT